MNRLQYAVVIATRNRAASLRLSLPRIMAQSRSPTEIVIVDSSDDHEEVARTVKNTIPEGSLAVTVIKSPRGLTAQRNAGLALTSSEVVFFPDDDSIWFPKTAEEILAVYERDSVGSISAVCAFESSSPPDGFDLDARDVHKIGRRERIRRRFAGILRKIEDLCFPDPFKVIGRSLYRAECLTYDHSYVQVEYMTGFRMSFRAEVIKEYGFDEVLTGYCLNEDIDASLGAWTKGMVVACKNAFVYHHKEPGRRGDGELIGAMTALNRAYLVVKHSCLGHPARGFASRYLCYKAAGFAMRSLPGYGVARFRGYLKAFFDAQRLLRLPADGVRDAYVTATLKMNVSPDK